MKAKLLSSLLVLWMFSVASYAQDFIEDDLYYQPNEKKQIIEQKKQETTVVRVQQQPATVTTTTSVTKTVQQESRDIDEYNRRYVSAGNEAENVSTSSQQVQATNQYINDDEYYYVDDDNYYQDFQDNGQVYIYTERIRKFHNPTFVLHISDPFYYNAFYYNSPGWSFYVGPSWGWWGDPAGGASGG